MRPWWNADEELVLVVQDYRVFCNIKEMMMYWKENTEKSITDLRQFPLKSFRLSLICHHSFEAQNRTIGLYKQKERKMLQQTIWALPNVTCQLIWGLITEHIYFLQFRSTLLVLPGLSFFSSPHLNFWERASISL